MSNIDVFIAGGGKWNQLGGVFTHRPKKRKKNPRTLVITENLNLGFHKRWSTFRITCLRRPPQAKTRPSCKITYGRFVNFSKTLHQLQWLPTTEGEEGDLNN